MQAPADQRHRDQIEISAAEFQQRLRLINSTDKSTNNPGRHSSVYSHLALVHKVAKAFAQEALQPHRRATVTIEELTNPPLSGFDETDEPVLIQFSYSD